LAKGAGESVEQVLIVLHENGDRLPVGTKRWLSPREINLHHHVRMNRSDDFKRLARFAAGRTIGLVLGGGGARGFAHMGVIRALTEAGVPLDIVGGTSIGALIAAQPAMGWDYQTMLEKNRECFVKAKPLSDYTIPLTSIIGGRKLDDCLKKGFQDIRIEDLWLNYFSLSSDLTTAQITVQRHGYLWEAVRASISIPGILPPVINGKSLLIDGRITRDLRCWVQT
jgi:NTE family protein